MKAEMASHANSTSVMFKLNCVQCSGK